LDALYLTEMVPDEGDDGHCLESGSSDPLVQVIILGTHDAPQSADRVAEAKEHCGNAIATGLGNANLEAQIAGPGLIRMHHRASLAVEKAGGPRKLDAIENGERWIRHVRSPFGRWQAMIEQMVDTVNGR
jgi:hypothetical protein